MWDFARIRAFFADRTILLWLLALLILIFLLSAIPLAVFITYLAPSPQKGHVETHPLGVIRTMENNIWPLRPEDDEYLVGSEDLYTTEIVPSNITGCNGYGFSCTNSPNIIIGINRRCDGREDCPDGSDEMDCQRCVTSFSCPLKAGSDRVRCLRADALCNGVAECADKSDEEKYCRKECMVGEYQCQSGGRCIPNEWRCDGEAHCPDGDDEKACEACNGGARLCGDTKSCIPKWEVCDGTMQCSHGEDETGCDCVQCSDADTALCMGPHKTCIKKRNVCDGIFDCPNGEDERSCQGLCWNYLQRSRYDYNAIEAEQKAAGRARRALTNDEIDSYYRNEIDEIGELFRNSTLKCADNKEYNWKYACSGSYPQCDSKCTTCNPETAFQCADKSKCIHRSLLCDGQEQCSDGSDELNCDSLIDCGDESKRCDGFKDCLDGRDEVGCAECKGRAFRCAKDSTCIPSHFRCDGEDHCSDGSDEQHCGCEECSIHPIPMYTCEIGDRCFKLSEVCISEGSRTRCPKPTRKDKIFCATRDRPFF